MRTAARVLAAAERGEQAGEQAAGRGASASLLPRRHRARGEGPSAVRARLLQPSCPSETTTCGPARGGGARSRRDPAEISPRSRRDLADLQPTCSRDVAEMVRMCPHGAPRGQITGAAGAVVHAAASSTSSSPLEALLHLVLFVGVGAAAPEAAGAAAALRGSADAGGPRQDGTHSRGLALSRASSAA